MIRRTRVMAETPEIKFKEKETMSRGCLRLILSNQTQVIERQTRRIHRTKCSTTSSVTSCRVTPQVIWRQRRTREKATCQRNLNTSILSIEPIALQVDIRTDSCSSHRVIRTSPWARNGRLQGRRPLAVITRSSWHPSWRSKRRRMSVTRAFTPWVSQESVRSLDRANRSCLYPRRHPGTILQQQAAVFLSTERRGATCHEIVCLWQLRIKRTIVWLWTLIQSH